MYDSAVEGEYRWVDCTSPASWILNNWSPGQPSDTAATENCVVGNAVTGFIDDRECDMPMNYICEVTPKGTTSGLLKRFVTEMGTLCHTLFI